MPKRYSTSEILAALYRAGFRQIGQRGSHIKLTDGEHVVIVPAGRREIRAGTFQSIVRQSGLPKSAFEG
ncbi:HicA toxin of bacterial toxin-antitoxin [Tepidimonas alkaliphilus]|uniref:HicA toxin of bacterial toxin-antitoxin n=1 Tax=Tepidimonas alkaliphilus TaxID=2588942 RepID=A0A554W412_9BURK|nr:type II toxin-antitoxin system HicA family toxin [Tepidimonas alkaliphilus]TSE18318.1 HicA toxin of bacterial toxin-antitoxin [Tepidimonas alkaliphilus]